jgi:hypothetical protein
MDQRVAFQERRLALLSSAIDISECTGLEIGASDLPTVPKGAGVCRYADFRTREEMVEMWQLPPETVCAVDYLLFRRRSVVEQIEDRFEYVIACHVLEHVPDPISFLNDLRSLLSPGPGKVIFLTLPDKRATLDRTRPSTTLERLLGYHFEKARSPSFEQVLEFHRHWVGYEHWNKPLPAREAYEYARTSIASGDADAHCHVWQDHEFHTQVGELIDEGFLPGLEIARFQPFYVGTNEFALILKSV